MTKSSLRFSRPLIFGVLNVTPDSFSDGGDFGDAVSALKQVEHLFESGADIADIGAESTRPGAEPVTPALEWQRLEVVLQGLKAKQLLGRISIDTRHETTMLRAAEMGAAWINCVGALPEEDILLRLKKYNPTIGFVATHMHGNPASMQLNPLSPAGAIKRVEAFFESAAAELAAGSFKTSEILFDPGIGFGKSDAANIALLARCAHWSQSIPIAIGVSRKGFFHRVFGVESPKDRDAVSKVAEASLALSGVRMIRTHDVSSLARCFSLLEEALA